MRPAARRGPWARPARRGARGPAAGIRPDPRRPVGEGAGFLQLPVEVLRVGGQPERLELCRLPRRVLADEHEVPIVGDQDQPIATPIAADLIAFGGEPSVVIDGFDFDHAVLRHLPLARLAALHLLGGVEAEVGMAGAQVRQLPDAEHLGSEAAADRVHEVFERGVARGFGGGAAGGADASQMLKIGFDRGRQLRHDRMVAAPITLTLALSHRERDRTVAPGPRGWRPEIFGGDIADPAVRPAPSPLGRRVG